MIIPDRADRLGHFSGVRLLAKSVGKDCTPKMSSNAPRMSHVLNGIAESGDGPRITVGEIMQALGARAFSLLIVVMGLPNSLPMPPPIALISGFLLAFISIQILIGWPSPWLPASVLKKSLARADVARAIATAIPWVLWVERLAKPRLKLLQHDLAWRVVGSGLLILSLALIAAVPVFGQIPLGIAFCLIGLGLVERDGFLVLAGFLLGAIGVGLSIGFVLALVTGAEKIF